MKLQVYKTEQGYVAVSDEEIKIGDWCILLDSLGNIFSSIARQYIGKEKGHYINDGIRKIVATDTSFKLEGIPQFELSVDIDWKEKRWLHRPSGKVYKLNGASGLIPEDESSNCALPVWLKDNSTDWIFIKQPRNLVAIEVDTYKDCSKGIECTANINNSCDGELIKKAKIVESEQYPDGLLIVKNYIYE